MCSFRSLFSFPSTKNTATPLKRAGQKDDALLRDDLHLEEPGWVPPLSRVTPAWKRHRSTIRPLQRTGGNTRYVCYGFPKIPLYSPFFLTVAIGNCMVKLIPPVNFCSDENIQTIFGTKFEDFLNYRTVEKVVKKIFSSAPE
jgi:hypothetical protein